MKVPSKILIFRQSSLGDVILTLPVIDRLSEAFPNCRIDYLTKTSYAPIARSHPAVSSVLSFDKNNPFVKIALRLVSQRYDLLIDLQGNLRSIMLRAMLFSTRTLHYNKRRLARERVVRHPQLKLSVDHTVMAYQSALKPLGIEIKVAPPVMNIPAEANQFATRFLSKVSKDSRLIALCPGARYFEKRWPEASFRQVAQMLLEEPSTTVVVFSAMGDVFPADLGICHPRLLPSRGMSLIESAAILARCKAALTNDSGLMHLANAVGTSVVAIFGPTNPRLGFAPTLPGSRIICDDVSCSPCSLHGKRPCSQPEKYCFEHITPQRAITELHLTML